VVLEGIIDCIPLYKNNGIVRNRAQEEEKREHTI
jgi:hypothetical protein